MHAKSGDDPIQNLAKGTLLLRSRAHHLAFLDTAEGRPRDMVEGNSFQAESPERSRRGAFHFCVRICANKVVAGVRCSTLLPTIRPQSTRQFASAQQIDQLEGLAVAIPWGFESPLPHQTSLACQAERASSRQASLRSLSRRSPKGEGGLSTH